MSILFTKISVNNNNGSGRQVKDNIYFSMPKGLPSPLIYLECVSNFPLNMVMSSVDFQANVGYKAGYFLYDYM